jgi:hypothetical protein
VSTASSRRGVEQVGGDRVLGRPRPKGTERDNVVRELAEFHGVEPEPEPGFERSWTRPSAATPS